MSNIDIGDTCLYCGKSTAPGSGLFVNRVPSFGQDRDQVAPSVQARYPEGTTFDGYYCAQCQANDCEACAAEKNDWRYDDGSPFDVANYIGATGALCDEHASMVFCTVCGEEVEFDQAYTKTDQDRGVVHATCGLGE